MTDQSSDGQFQALGDLQLSLPKEAPSVRHHNRHPFTAEEDELLKQKVSQFGTNAWHDIETQIPGRSARQCRERWNHYLSPEVENGPWTPEDDQLLLSYYHNRGPKWTVIAKQFNKRTANSIKNRIKVHLRRQRREGNSTHTQIPLPQNTDILNQVQGLSQVFTTHSFAPVDPTNPQTVELPAANPSTDNSSYNQIELPEVISGVPSNTLSPISGVSQEVPVQQESVEVPSVQPTETNEIIVPNLN